MNELKPCPFCGGEATVERIGLNGCYYVACNTTDCCDFGKSDTEAEAIAAWNARTERTCVIESTVHWDSQPLCDFFEHRLSCGHTVRSDFREPPKFCEECGAKVVGE